jgi:hypothetical protein
MLHYYIIVLDAFVYLVLLRILQEKNKKKRFLLYLNHNPCLYVL